MVDEVGNIDHDVVRVIVDATNPQLLDNATALFAHGPNTSFWIDATETLTFIENVSVSISNGSTVCGWVYEYDSTYSINQSISFTPCCPLVPVD